MSDTEEKVLGKRERDEAQDMDAEPSNGAAPESKRGTQEIEEDSDDDVGPMPMPAGDDENGQTVRKKRKGTHLMHSGDERLLTSVAQSFRTRSSISSTYRVRTGMPNPSCTAIPSTSSVLRVGQTSL